MEDPETVRTRPISLVTSLALLALLVAAQPAGAYQEALNTGTTGEYENAIQDEMAAPGVTCRYENNPGAKNDELDKIRVRAIYAHGPFAKKSYVGYRFIVKRQAGEGPYKTVHKSPIVKKLASTVEVAAFPARTWTAPEGTRSRHRVQILLYWYAKGSSTNVIGRTRGIMEAYKHVLTPTKSYVLGDQGDAAWCVPNYHGL
jgi:hypothetical protein